MPNTFSGKLYWSERILDFVGQAACHFAPGGIALCFDQLAGIIKNNDIACGFFGLLG